MSVLGLLSRFCFGARLAVRPCVRLFNSIILVHLYHFETSEPMPFGEDVVGSARRRKTQGVRGEELTRRRSAAEMLPALVRRTSEARIMERGIVRKYG